MKLKKFGAIVAVAAFSVASASATISINFNGTGAAMAVADEAGVLAARASNWNNIAGGNSSLGSLNDTVLGATSASVSISGGGLGMGGWRLNLGTTTGDSAMWDGFFETDGTPATISVANLPYATAYDVYVYFDGDNDRQWRSANYTIGATSFNGVEDSENTNWGKGQNASKIYQHAVPGGSGNGIWPVVGPNNNEGNYIVFSGVTGASFDLILQGSAAESVLRVAVNGMQIVPVPEPSSSALLGLGGLALVLRRRRK